MSLDSGSEGQEDPIEAIQRFIVATRRMQGRQLTNLRERAGLTQDQLARRLGFGRSTVANAERGHRSASADFWQRADEVLGARGALQSRYEKLQEATRQHVELLAQRAERTLVAELADQSHSIEALSAGAAQEAITAAGLRISAAVLDLLIAVRDSVEPGRLRDDAVPPTGLPPFHLSEPALSALRQVQDETGQSPSGIADRSIRLYSYVRALLAQGAEVLIREPGREEHAIRLR